MLLTLCFLLLLFCHTMTMSSVIAWFWIADENILFIFCCYLDRWWLLWEQASRFFGHATPFHDDCFCNLRPLLVPWPNFYSLGSSWMAIVVTVEGLQVQVWLGCRLATFIFLIKFLFFFAMSPRVFFIFQILFLSLLIKFCFFDVLFSLFQSLKGLL